MRKKQKTTSDERALSIIHKPLLTEKSTNLNQFNQYSFVVNKESNVIEIKSAIEKIFKVKVTKVNTSIIRGKAKTVVFKWFLFILINFPYINVTIISKLDKLQLAKHISTSSFDWPCKFKLLISLLSHCKYVIGELLGKSIDSIE